MLETGASDHRERGASGAKDNDWIEKWRMHLPRWTLGMGARLDGCGRGETSPRTATRSKDDGWMTLRQATNRKLFDLLELMDKIYLGRFYGKNMVDEIKQGAHQK